MGPGIFHALCRGTTFAAAGTDATPLPRHPTMTTSATTTTTGSATTTPTTARTTTTAPTIVSSTAPSVTDFNYCGHLRLAAATMMTTAGHNSKGAKEGSDETGPSPLLLRR